jgi:hypothetical protein
MASPRSFARSFDSNDQTHRSLGKDENRSLLQE